MTTKEAWHNEVELPAYWKNDKDGLLEDIEYLMKKYDTDQEVIGRMVRDLGVKGMSTNNKPVNVEDVYYKARKFLENKS